MPLAYMSGEEIKKGDQVRYHGEPGEIEFVADPFTLDSNTQWYVEKYGGGVMVLEPKVFGSVFLSKPHADEHLEFIRRGCGSTTAGSAD